MIATARLRQRLEDYTNSPDILGDDVSEDVRALQLLAEEVRDFLDANPKLDQAIALLKRVEAGKYGSFAHKPFDLPDDYVLLTSHDDGFTCGIAPDGAVSS